jgi:hypothetical protein
MVAPVSPPTLHQPIRIPSKSQTQHLRWESYGGIGSRRLVGHFSKCVIPLRIMICGHPTNHQVSRRAGSILGDLGKLVGPLDKAEPKCSSLRSLLG